MYLIVGFITARGIWKCLEKTSLQAIKDKKFQLTHQLQTIKLGNKPTNKYLKEFKNICDGLAAIHKPVYKDNRVISFATGLGPKYRIFGTIMLIKPPSLTQN